MDCQAIVGCAARAAQQARAAATSQLGNALAAELVRK